MLVWGNCVWDAPSIGEQSTGAASTGRQPVRVKSVGAAGGEFTLLRTHEKVEESREASRRNLQQKGSTEIVGSMEDRNGSTEDIKSMESKISAPPENLV